MNESIQRAVRTCLEESLPILWITELDQTSLEPACNDQFTENNDHQFYRGMDKSTCYFVALW